VADAPRTRCASSFALSPTRPQGPARTRPSPAQLRDWFVEESAALPAPSDLIQLWTGRHRFETYLRVYAILAAGSPPEGDPRCEVSGTAPFPLVNSPRARLVASRNTGLFRRLEDTRLRTGRITLTQGAGPFRTRQRP